MYHRLKTKAYFSAFKFNVVSASTFWYQNDDVILQLIIFHCKYFAYLMLAVLLSFLVNRFPYITHNPTSLLAFITILSK